MLSGNDDNAMNKSPLLADADWSDMVYGENYCGKDIKSVQPDSLGPLLFHISLVLQLFKIKS